MIDREREEIRSSDDADLKLTHTAAEYGRMALIKLNRINKGGEILLNSEHVMSVEIETRSTTVRLTDGQLFSVEESIDAIAQLTEQVHADRIKQGILGSGLGVRPLADPHLPALPADNP